MTRTAAALIVFILTYSVFAIGKFPWLRLDRTGVTFAGAVLLGMMIVVANLRLSSVFTSFARGLLLNARSGYGLLAMTGVDLARYRNRHVNSCRGLHTMKVCVKGHRGNHVAADND